MAVCLGVPPPPHVTSRGPAHSSVRWCCPGAAKDPCLLVPETWPGWGAVVLDGSPVACPSELGSLSWAQGWSPTMETFSGGQPLASVPRGVQQAPELCSPVP